MPQNLTTKLIRTRSEFEALAPAWLALESLAVHDAIFQSFGWTRAVWDFETASAHSKFTPLIALAYEDERLIAVLPLEVVRTGLRTVLVPIGYVFTQISNVLLAPGFDPKTVISALIAAAQANGNYDTVLFNKVREGSSLAKGMPDNHLLTGDVLGAPVVDLGAFPDFASYFQTIRTKTRKNIRNARNRLERCGTLEHHSVDAPQDQLALIQRTLKGRSDRLKEQGLTSRAFASPQFTRFCESLVSCSDITLAAFSLTHAQNPIAEQWGFVHGGRYYAFVATRDFSHSDESPGKMHLAEVTKACFERGLSACDLGIPVMPYKLTWATHTETVRDYAITLTSRGKFLVLAWDKFLRPKLKHLVLHTPTGLRSALMRIVTRTK